MDMSMGGMDMSASSGPFRPINQKIARSYWYAVSGVVGLLTVFRICRVLEGRQQRRHIDSNSAGKSPSRTGRIPRQAVATATAILRELSYPQPLYFTGRFSKYFTLLPLGRWLILVLYWTMLLAFLWTGTIIGPSSPMYPYKWEIVGFRAAWVSITQIPFIYLLSCTFNPITLLTGISYERFNWLHRWAARTLFLAVIVHWSFFFTEWSLAGFVKIQLEMMSMVKYGFGAWAVIGWMILSGFGFFRALSYEIFVAHHICAAATLLWLLYVHVPGYARYNVYMAIGFVAFDWMSRIGWAVMRNMHVLDKIKCGKVGYAASLEALPGDMVRVVIQDAAFSWKAGQHIYVSMPRLGPFELHPFTIANASSSQGREQDGASLKMLVKAHSGFSRRLYRAASEGALGRTFKTFVSGPWGYSPDLRSHESIVFIACASGASFTVPLLQELIGCPASSRRAAFHWIIRSIDHMPWYKKELIAAVETARRRSLHLQVSVHVTQASAVGEVAGISMESGIPGKEISCVADLRSDLQSSSSRSESMAIESGPLCSQVQTSREHSRLLVEHDGRPSIDSLIRPTVEAARGETAVVVCGGTSVTAQVRTFVAALSDERAVHKGSGAQGIFLFTETYGW